MIVTHGVSGLIFHWGHIIKSPWVCTVTGHSLPPLGLSHHCEAQLHTSLDHQWVVEVPSMSHFCDLYRSLSVRNQLFSGMNSPHRHTITVTMWHCHPIRMSRFYTAAMSHCYPAAMSHCYTATMSRCYTVTRPHYCTAPMWHNHTDTIPYCHIATMPHCHTAKMPHCHTATIQHFHTDIIPHHHTGTMTHCHTVTIPHCHPATMSLCHTATMMHWQTTTISDYYDVNMSKGAYCNSEIIIATFFYMDAIGVTPWLTYLPDQSLYQNE